jgi:hypothetical protein
LNGDYTFYDKKDAGTATRARAKRANAQNAIVISRKEVAQTSWLDAWKVVACCKWCKKVVLF